jgi:hypothetical protein
LYSGVYRYALFFSFEKVTNMGFHDSIPFFWLFLPHLLLPISGFGFKIPPKRPPDGNRIWGEYNTVGMHLFSSAAASH